MYIVQTRSLLYLTFTFYTLNWSYCYTFTALTNRSQ